MFREQFHRRFLPHWFMPGAAHFITYRLAGTLPAAVVQEFRDERDRTLKLSPPRGVTMAEYKARVQKQFFAKYDAYLDGDTQLNWLADPRVAAMVRENLYHHADKKYRLLAYCVMPNHVHIVIVPLEIAGNEEKTHKLAACATEERADVINADGLSDEVADSGSPLSSIMHSLKSYTANRANEMLGLSGTFWQRESYDHWIRDSGELERIVEYVRQNPVKPRLCEHPEDWGCCSARDRVERDGARTGFLIDP